MGSIAMRVRLAVVLPVADHDGRPNANAPVTRDIPFNTSRRFMPIPLAACEDQ